MRFVCEIRIGIDTRIKPDTNYFTQMSQDFN